MKISTDNPDACHNMMYDALDRYKAPHRYFEILHRETGLEIFQCTNCKATLHIEYEQGAIKSFTFDKRWCDKEE